MRSTAFAGGVLCLAASLVEAASAPPPVPPPPKAAAPAPVPVPAPPAGPTKTAAQLQAEEDAEHTALLTAGTAGLASSAWKEGAWLYGSLESDTDISPRTAAECMKKCEATAACLHWTFLLHTGRCDLAQEGGGYDSHKKGFITGNSTRYRAPKTEL